MRRARPRAPPSRSTPNRRCWTSRPAGSHPLPQRRCRRAARAAPTPSRSGLPGATSRPVSPSPTASPTPPTSVATTATPAAIASSTDSGNASHRGAEHHHVEARQIRAHAPARMQTGAPGPHAQPLDLALHRAGQLAVAHDRQPPGLGGSAAKPHAPRRAGPSAAAATPTRPASGSSPLNSSSSGAGACVRAGHPVVDHVRTAAGPAELFTRQPPLPFAHRDHGRRARQQRLLHRPVGDRSGPSERRREGEAMRGVDRATRRAPQHGAHEGARLGAVGVHQIGAKAAIQAPAALGPPPRSPRPGSRRMSISCDRDPGRRQRLRDRAAGRQRHVHGPATGRQATAQAQDVLGHAAVGRLEHLEHRPLRHGRRL